MAIECPKKFPNARPLSVADSMRLNSNPWVLPGCSQSVEAALCVLGGACCVFRASKAYESVVVCRLRQSLILLAIDVVDLIN